MLISRLLVYSVDQAHTQKFGTYVSHSATFLLDSQLSDELLFLSTLVFNTVCQICV